MERCVIFGGGEIADMEFVRSLIRKDDYIICADLGLRYCTKLGLTPDLILGDFDSYEGELPEGGKILRYPVEKDDTDTMLAVKEAIASGCREVIMVGMLGGRLDHTLANIQTVVYAVRHGIRAAIADRGCYITAIKDGQSAVIPYEEGSHFSVFSHTDASHGVGISGAKYELESADITNAFPIGVSNAFLPGRDAVVSVGEGTLVIIVNQGE